MIGLGAKYLQYWIDWCLNDDMGSTRLLRYLDGELVGVPWVVARNISLSCGSG